MLQARSTQSNSETDFNVTIHTLPDGSFTLKARWDWTLTQFKQQLQQQLPGFPKGFEDYIALLRPAGIVLFASDFKSMPNKTLAQHCQRFIPHWRYESDKVLYLACPQPSERGARRCGKEWLTPQEQEKVAKSVPYLCCPNTKQLITHAVMLGDRFYECDGLAKYLADTIKQEWRSRIAPLPLPHGEVISASWFSMLQEMEKKIPGIKLPSKKVYSKQDWCDTLRQCNQAHFQVDYDAIMRSKSSYYETHNTRIEQKVAQAFYKQPKLR